MDSSPDLSLKLRRGSSDSRDSFYMDFAQGIDSDIEEVTTTDAPSTSRPATSTTNNNSADEILEDDGGELDVMEAPVGGVGPVQRKTLTIQIPQPLPSPSQLTPHQYHLPPSTLNIIRWVFFHCIYNVYIFYCLNAEKFVCVFFYPFDLLTFQSPPPPRRDLFLFMNREQKAFIYKCLNYDK